jgi:integrase/recombinase XerD
MINHFETFEDLTDAIVEYLENWSFSSQSLCNYQTIWRDLASYMKARHITHYDAGIGAGYLAQTVGTIDYKLLSRWDRNRIRVITALSDFNETGSIRLRKKKKPPIVLDGPIGKMMVIYIAYSENLHNLAGKTVRSYQLYLSIFLRYLYENKISSPDQFNPGLLTGFVKSLYDYSVITRHLIILKTNQFLKYLYDHQFIAIDYSKVVPKGNYVRQPKLPSFFSTQEIQKLLTTIDRASPNGKRDYAMILLIVMLGLRCSDVANLKFDNIVWERQQITLNQKKTKGALDLPLLPDVGDAIIDYLKYGRPQSCLSYIFLRQIPPYHNMDDNVLYAIIKKYLNRAGIKYDERKHGPHALRHSLATQLLANETPLPVISAILGHVSSDSTMNYLRVDMNSLSKCALAVTPLSTDKLKGGNQ